jgi:hypothetical protein
MSIVFLLFGNRLPSILRELHNQPMHEPRQTVDNRPLIWFCLTLFAVMVMAIAIHFIRRFST